MNVWSLRFLRGFVSSLVLFSFALIGLLTLRLALDVELSDAMGECPMMMDGSSFCAMDGLQQLTDWQQIFIFAFRPTHLAALLVVPVLLFFVEVLLGRVIVVDRFLLHRLHLYRFKEFCLKPFDAFAHWAFSGLLHPLVYQKIKA